MKKNKIGKYRAVSILNEMSKIYERCIHNSISSCTDTVLSNCISAYKKSYSSNHVLFRFIENWSQSRENKNFVGAVLIDFPKAFDCIPHDLIAAKLHAYVLSGDAVTFVYSYLKRRKQGVKINGTESVFQIILSGTPQTSILGPILFTVLINDLFSILKTFNLQILHMAIQYMQPGIVWKNS